LLRGRNKTPARLSGQGTRKRIRTLKNESHALPPGTRVEQFVIERFLGLGGFGVTYLAWDESLRVWRALKEYLPDRWGTRFGDGTVGPATAAHADDYEWGLDRFVREAQMLAKFRHRHIVQVYQVVAAFGTAYMVMEYVEGRTLEQEVKAEGPLSEDRVRSLLLSLTEGLSVVHAEGLLHRDIKPANVMVRGDGSPVLIDFGAARQAMGARASDVTQFQSAGFSPYEQELTESEEGSPQTEMWRQGPWTDVYALGAVAYWALSGKVPHRAARRMVSDDLRPVSAVAHSEVSAELSSAVDAALAMRPVDRPRSLAVWRRLLTPPAVSEPASTEKPEPQPNERKERKNPPGWLWWWLGVPAAGVVVVAMLFALDALQNGSASNAEPTGAAVETGNASGDGVGDRPGGEPTPVRPPSDPPSPEAVEAGLDLDRTAWRLIQLGLASSGFDPGLVDGTGSPGTRRALGAWQAYNRHSPTGYLDAAAASALLAAGRDPRAGTVFRECALCPGLVVVPAGRFRMGCLSGGDCRGHELPVHEVDLASFALGVYEVTFEQYDRFVTATGHRRPTDHGWGRGGRPVIDVSWEDAAAYVAWLSDETGAGYRLPSESEWEYAARAGTATRYFWGQDIGSNRANCFGCGGRWNGASTAPAGSFAANAWGLHDMAGNVREWVEDCWHEGYTGAPRDGSAWTSGGDCGRRVLRDGAWINSAETLRPGARGWSNSVSRNRSFGFRVSRTLD